MDLIFSSSQNTDLLHKVRHPLRQKILEHREDPKLVQEMPKLPKPEEKPPEVNTQWSKLPLMEQVEERQMKPQEIPAELDNTPIQDVGTAVQEEWGPQTPQTTQARPAIAVPITTPTRMTWITCFKPAIVRSRRRALLPAVYQDKYSNKQRDLTRSPRARSNQ